MARVGVTTLYHWEHGVSTPSVDVLGRVMTALGRDISEVVLVDPTARFPGDWRVLRGLTQPELGKRAGISTSMVGAIERGETQLTERTADALAKALGISTAELAAAHERARAREPGTPA